MDFDHRPGETKCFSISSAVCCRKSRVLAEMAKCDLVCANCHRTRTRRRSQYWTEGRQRPAPNVLEARARADALRDIAAHEARELLDADPDML